MNGIIFFEDGAVAKFGNLKTVQNIAITAQELLPQLLMQERQQLLDSLSDGEIKKLLDRYAAAENKKNDDHSDL